MRKRRFYRIIGITLLLFSLTLIAYPTVSDYIEKDKIDRAISAFDDTAAELAAPTDSTESTEATQADETAPVSPRVRFSEEKQIESHPDVERLYEDSKGSYTFSPGFARYARYYRDFL